MFEGMKHTTRPHKHNCLSLVIVLTLAGSLVACSESSSETTVTAAPTTTEAVPTTESVAPETTSPATAAPTTTAAPVVVTIDPDGIGEGKLGGEPDSVIAYFTTLFGPPTSDSGWVDAGENCRPPTLRAVNWPDLYAIFAPWDAFGADVADDPQLVWFAYGFVLPENLTVPLGTPRGLVIGDTEDRLRELYPEATVYNGAAGGGRFYSFSDDIVGPNGIISESGFGVSTIGAGDWPCDDVNIGR